MLWTAGLLLVFISSVFGENDHIVNIDRLKKQWTHPDFTSFDHYWNESWGGDEVRPMTTVMKLIEEHRVVCKLEGKCPLPTESIRGARTNCVNGNAGGYECSNIDLLAFISLTDLGSASNADGNDIWGYTAGDGRKYAITGQTDGASIVDVTDPINPEVLVWIQSQRTQNTIWRDMKVYNGYVYIVADGSGHGLQYINLDEQIAAARAASSRPIRILRGDVPRNALISNCHNIAINTDTGYAFAVGANTASGGLYMYDLANPANPIFAGQFASDGYTHDVECILYSGPDSQYVGRDICFGYNENSVTIVDVSNRNSPTMLSRTTYANSAYTHQGWITEDHRYIIMNDELDEQRFGFTTRSRVFDVSSLGSPSDLGYFTTGLAAVDHNLYIKGNYVYEANYRSGLRVLDISSLPNVAGVSETAFFDTYPGSNSASFDGAWSNYPFFEYTEDEYNNVVVVQDINRGLFVFQVNL